MFVNILSTRHLQFVNGGPCGQGLSQQVVEAFSRGPLKTRSDVADRVLGNADCGVP